MRSNYDSKNAQENVVASHKERFDLLYHTLERYNERFVTAVVSVAGVLLVLIGWLLTSVTAREFFEESTISTLGTLIIIVVLIAIYWYSITRVYGVNRQVFQQLRELNYIEEKYYKHHCLPSLYKYIGVGLNVCNYIIIGVLILDARWPYF